MPAEETAGDSLCFVTLYDLPYSLSALHGNVLLCKKKQITTERRNASPAVCYEKVWANGMLARSYFYADKPAPFPLQLHAQNCSRSRRSDLRLHALLHHGTGWESKDHGGCMVSPCPAQGGSGRTALLVPFSWCPKGTVAPIHS